MGSDDVERSAITITTSEIIRLAIDMTINSNTPISPAAMAPDEGPPLPAIIVISNSAQG